MNLVNKYFFVSFEKIFKLDAVVMLVGSSFQIWGPIIVMLATDFSSRTLSMK